MPSSKKGNYLTLKMMLDMSRLSEGHQEAENQEKQNA
jgi:hypothetical protein